MQLSFSDGRCGCRVTSQSRKKSAVALTGKRRKPGTQELVSPGDDGRNGYCSNAALGKAPADGEESKVVKARVTRCGVTQKENRVVSET